MLLVVYQPGATGDAVGITLTLVSIGFCALYAVLTRRLLLLDDSALSVVIAQQTAALLFAIVLATVVELAGGTGWDLAGHGRGDWAAAAASGLLYYGLGFWLFVTGLRWVPASVAGSFLPLIAVFGLAAGYPRRGTARVAAVGGSGLVLAATVAIARPQHQPVAPSPPSADTQIPEQGSVPDDRVG